MGGRLNKKTISCPSCGTTDISTVGPIFDYPFFAGLPLSHPLPSSVLTECHSCHLKFRTPPRDQELLKQLYVDGSGDAWMQASEDRPDYQIVKSLLERKLPGGRVLDVGCFDGRFLASLSDRFHKYGIEPNQSARRELVKKGITVIGETVDDLASLDQQFDAIVAVDLIEHIQNPYEFISIASALLRSRGVLVLSTGDSDHWLWRLMKGRYWYAAIPEHISFINRRWCRYVAERLGLGLIEVRNFSHQRTSWLQVTRQGLANALYALLPTLFFIWRSKRYPDLLSDQLRYPPSWISARDHFAVTFIKDGSVDED